MAKEAKAATPEVVAEAEPVFYEVKVSKRITIHDFHYLPSHQHVVDKTIYDEMDAAGVIADVKQLS